MSPLIENCDQWHLSELTDRWDGSIVSVAVLRRDLVSVNNAPYRRRANVTLEKTKLIARVRDICDCYVDSHDSDSVIVDR
jgi:hypothetical protein